MSSASRVVRCTNFRRIFLFVWVVLVVVVVVSLYSNTLSQLDNVRKSNEQCHQQQENLSTQLQVIFDYKQRLEKSLKTEKAEHQQDNKKLEAKFDGEKTKNDKESKELKLKFDSLQQHYNLLQTQYDDYKEERNKFEKQQLVEIHNLQMKLKELQERYKKDVEATNTKFEHLKSEYSQLLVDKENLEKHINQMSSNKGQSQSYVNHLMKLNHQLQRELAQSKLNSHGPSSSSPTYIQVEHDMKPSKREETVLPINNPVNVADFPSNGEVIQQQQEQVVAPKTGNRGENELERRESVLAMPNMRQDADLKSSTKTAFVVNKSSHPSLGVVQPLVFPTVSSSTAKTKVIPKRREDVLPMPLPYRPSNNVPEGVVPIAKNNGESKPNNKLDETDIREDVNNAFPNRYRANLIQNEIVNEDQAIEANEKEKIHEAAKKTKKDWNKIDAADKENNALEVFDPPADNNNNNDEDKLLLEGDAFGLDPKEKNQAHVQEGANKAVNGGDYDKDIQLEENDPEAEDDDPEDYAVDHMLRQKEPAVRN